MVVPHVTLATRRKLAELGWQILPHPPYFADGAPSDYHLFLFLQHFLQDKRMVQLVDSRDTTLFKNGIYKLQFWWQEVINSDGNYIIK